MPDRNAALVLLIPVPQKDGKGMPVPKARKREATHRMLIALGSWFGSATALPSWGSWKAEPGASLSIDRGQTVLLVMTTPGSFRRHRPDLVRLLQKEGIGLNQDQMAAIAFRSAQGSVLIQCKT